MKKINNEAKVRRNTKKLVLGTAKVMSYEDLEIAREQRAAKDAAKAKRKVERDEKAERNFPGTKETTGRAKIVRKRKSAEPEASSSNSKRIQKARISDASEPARAPVARTI